MSIRLVVSDTVKVRVQGSLPNGDGGSIQFDYSLICDRLSSDELEQLQEDKVPVKVALLDRTKGWEQVLDESDQPVPFSREGFERLLKIIGMEQLAFARLIVASGAKGKEKN